MTGSSVQLLQLANSISNGVTRSAPSGGKASRICLEIREGDDVARISIREDGTVGVLTPDGTSNAKLALRTSKDTGTMIKDGSLAIAVAITAGRIKSVTKPVPRHPPAL